MKISLAVVAALAASTPSLSLSILTEPQIIELLSSGPGSPVPETKHHAKNGWSSVKSYVESITGPKAAIKPCHGLAPHSTHVHAGPSTYLPGPIGSLLSRLGFTPGEKGLDSHFNSHVHMEVVSAIKDQVASHRNAEALKDRLEEMIHHVEAETIPLMEGGIIKILPLFNGFGDIASPEQVEQQKPKFRTGMVPVRPGKPFRISEWDEMVGKDGVKAVHHNHHHHEHYHGQHAHHGQAGQGRSFGCRLNQALKSLKPAESFSLAFVLGAGIGSLLHLFFMVILLSIRRIRGGRDERCKARQERRKARAERRAARKSAKEAGKSSGTVRLESEDESEVLPAYGQDEHDRLVEKA